MGARVDGVRQGHVVGTHVVGNMPPRGCRHNAPQRVINKRSCLMFGSGRFNALARFGGVALVAGLSGCSALSEDIFPPLCPQPTIMADAADLRVYDGIERPADLAYATRVSAINGVCSRGATRTSTHVSVTVSLDALRGPAGAARSLTIPYFIAVVRNGRVLDKQAFAMDAQLGSAAAGQKIVLQSDPVELELPTPEGVSASDYRVVAGLQLTEAQLSHNRALLAGGQR